MKKKLVITIAAGLLSFGGTFAVAWFTAKTPASTQAQQPAGSPEQPGDKLSGPQDRRKAPIAGLAPITDEATQEQMRTAMTEKQLKSLVSEVREKIQEYEDKLQGLRSREQQLETAHGELKKDIDDLNTLRIELASTIASLKEEHANLQKTRIEIEKTEQVNLMAIAATYDKMDPASASTILTNMAQVRDGNPNDAIKILHYMGDRTKANVLAELSNTAPELAAYFCQRLKQMVEKK
ncbi:MAG: hypothetical protein JXN61_07635 [Sedimentisphaerales bacterium]|nr:hypothetical protein [Sedimentisphaerales bacterium]